MTSVCAGTLASNRERPTQGWTRNACNSVCPTTTRARMAWKPNTLRQGQRDELPVWQRARFINSARESKTALPGHGMLL
jgi:hypothetical protein